MTHAHDAYALHVRIESLPYNRDGFWMGSIQRLYPQNERSNWEGQWLPDGPGTEVFASVSSPFSIALMIDA